MNKTIIQTFYDFIAKFKLLRVIFIWYFLFAFERGSHEDQAFIESTEIYLPFCLPTAGLKGV